MGFGSDSYLMPPLTLGEGSSQDESDAARLQRYRAYLDFYQGAQWAERRKPGERRLTINYARTFVQKGASYLMGKPVRFELIPNESTPEAARLAQQTEQALANIWSENNLALLDYDAAVDAAVLGDCAFKVTQENQTNFSLFGSPASTSVKVRAVDVLNLTAGWRGDDMRALLWVRERYSLSRAEAEARFSLALHNSKAAKTRKTQVWVAERWTTDELVITVDDKPVYTGANPYRFIPYILIPNLTRPRQFWGQSDLEDIMSLNSEFNVRVSILSQLLQVSGNPVLVLENVDSAENMRVGPGAVWTLPEGARATLLEMLKDGSVQLHMDYINLLYRMMHDLSELPGTGFGRDEAFRASSGLALDILLHPISQRVQRKRRIWEAALEQRNRFILELAGLPAHRSRIIWPDVLPKDRAALVAQEVGLVASSIHSLETARRNLGDEQPDAENERILHERATLGELGSMKAGAPVRLSGALVQGLNQ